MASLAMPFSKILRMLTNHLATKRVWSMILQPILRTSAEEAHEDRLAAQ